MNPGAILRVFAFMFFVLPATAFACECTAASPMLSPISQRYGYPLVFVGRVTAVESKPSPVSISPDGRFASISISLEGTARVAVERQFRGAPVSEIRISLTGSNCDPRLIQTQSYLFYDSAGDGSSVSFCNAPVPLPEAAEDLKYIEGVRTRQAQAILYGWVSQEISGVPSSAPAGIVVVMEGGGREFRQPYPSGRGFQLVVPPAEYRVWVERQGIRLTTPQTFRLRDGDALRQQLTIRQ